MVKPLKLLKNSNSSSHVHICEYIASSTYLFSITLAHRLILPYCCYNLQPTTTKQYQPSLNIISHHEPSTTMTNHYSQDYQPNYWPPSIITHRWPPITIYYVSLFHHQKHICCTIIRHYHHYRPSWTNVLAKSTSHLPGSRLPSMPSVDIASSGNTAVLWPRPATPWGQGMLKRKNRNGPINSDKPWVLGPPLAMGDEMWWAIISWWMRHLGGMNRQYDVGKWRTVEAPGIS